MTTAALLASALIATSPTFGTADAGVLLMIERRSEIALTATCEMRADTSRMGEGHVLVLLDPMYQCHAGPLCEMRR